MKVAILGANGQVGAEVCMILRNHENISLVPVCRNRLGSAYLRYQGIACRHGYPTDNIQAKMLLGDCPVVANFALSGGMSHKVSEVNKRLIRNSIECSPHGSTILYFSTVAVYGDPTLGKWLRWKNSYTKEKLRCERLAIKYGKEFNKKVYVLRLGHVCGQLQNITNLIQEDIINKNGTVTLPDRKSNVVHVSTVADAILKASSDCLGRPGIYDLLNIPQWTWKEIYEFEANNVGHQAYINHSNNEKTSTVFIKAIDLITHIVKAISSNPVSKECIRSQMVYLPDKINYFLQAIYYKNRAMYEISALNQQTINNNALNWMEMGECQLTALAKTREIIRKKKYSIQNSDLTARWPNDIEMYIK